MRSQWLVMKRRDGFRHSADRMKRAGSIVHSLTIKLLHLESRFCSTTNNLIVGIDEIDDVLRKTKGRTRKVSSEGPAARARVLRPCQRGRAVIDGAESSLLLDMVRQAWQETLRRFSCATGAACCRRSRPSSLLARIAVRGGTAVKIAPRLDGHPVACGRESHRLDVEIAAEILSRSSSSAS